MRSRSRPTARWQTGASSGRLCQEGVATNSYGPARRGRLQRCLCRPGVRKLDAGIAGVAHDRGGERDDRRSGPAGHRAVAGHGHMADGAPRSRSTATDASGIASVELRSGTQSAGSKALACDFRHLQPCPETGAGTFALDVADGSHVLTALATDAAGQVATSALGTLKLDRQPPAAPEGLSVQPSGTGRYVYTWRNPDQGAMAPIVAAHLSDGTVVKGSGITQLESASPVERIYLEDEAGNADPATAVGISSSTAPSTPAADPAGQRRTPAQAEQCAAKRHPPDRQRQRRRTPPPRRSPRP